MSSEFSQIGILDQNEARVNPSTEDTQLAIAGLITSAYDYVGVAYPTSSTEVYTFRLGGVSGTVVGIITITYTDATKENLLSVEKT